MAIKKESMTPGDLLLAIVGNDPKAIVGAIKGKNKAENKYASRAIGKNEKGEAVVKKVKLTKEYEEKHGIVKAVKKTKKTKTSKK